MLLEDGVLYYLVVIAIQILTSVSFFVPSDLTIPLVRAYPTFVVIGVACNRLFSRLQSLLLSKGKGQTGFSTIDAWSSAMPNFTYGGDRTDGESNARTPHVQLGKKRHQSITDLDIRMGPIGKMTPMYDD